MSFDDFRKVRFLDLSMFEFSKQVRETIFLMSFDEFRKVRFLDLSMFEFSKQGKETIFLMSFDEFRQVRFLDVSMFDCTKQGKEVTLRLLLTIDCLLLFFASSLICKLLENKKMQKWVKKLLGIKKKVAF